MTASLDSNQRVALLRRVASGERQMEGDVVARIALDELNELNRVLEIYKTHVNPEDRKRV